MNSTRLAKWPLLAVLAVGVSACDLEVQNPGTIQDDDLNTPDLMPILVAGVSGEYNDIQDNVAFDGAILSDDAAGTGSYGTTQLFRQGIFDDRDSDDYWEDMHEAAWAAGEAWIRLQEVLGEAEANSSALSARVFALMGHAHNRLGEHYCDLVYDVGGVQDRAVAFDSAIVAFNRAITIGGAAGSGADDYVLSAYAGIAQARLGKAALGTGTWAEAAAAAQDFFDNGGTEQWADYAIYHAQANQNIIWQETHGRAEIGVYTTLAQTLHDDTGDVRVPYTRCGEWSDDPPVAGQVTPQGCTSGSGAHQGADGLTVNYRQDKYPERGSDIPRATGVEMRLIMAEAALMEGDLPEFANQINAARQSYNDASLPDIAVPTVEGELDFFEDYPHYEYPAVDAWSILDQERYASLWLTGKRLFDLDRWNHPFLAGGYLARDIPGAAADNPRVSCMPIPRNECELNPNITTDPACS